MFRFCPQRPIACSRRAFTLVEILIVVVILGILAAIVIPQFANASQAAKDVAFVASLDSFVKGLNHFDAVEEAPAPDGSSGVCPPELESYINKEQYETGTPLGGVWDIEAGASGLIELGVGVHFNDGTNPGDAYMALIDQQIDDGNLATGGFQKIEADRYYSILLP